MGPPGLEPGTEGVSEQKFKENYQDFKSLRLLNIDVHRFVWLTNRHKGLLLVGVPSDYKQWLFTQGDINPFLRKALVTQELLALTL